MFFGVLSTHVAQAYDSFQRLYRGARANAMGNAFVAVADDEQAIFYNPAGLAGVKRISLNMLTVDTQGSADIVTNLNAILTSLSNPSISSINTLLGRNFYLEATGTAGLIAPGFGVTALYDYWATIGLQNSASPQGVMGGQNTYGAQMAVGFRAARMKRGGEVRVGFAAKILKRSGGLQYPDLQEIMNLSYSSFASNARTYGTGYGLDAGVQLIYPIKKWTLQLGVAMTDIGNTTFSGGGDVQLSCLTAGAAFVYAGKEVTATFAGDYGRILDGIDWRKKIHFGMEVKFPILSLYAGMNQLDPTFGVGLSLGLIKVLASSYAVELGTSYGQITERRYMLHTQFRFDL